MLRFRTSEKEQTYKIYAAQNLNSYKKTQYKQNKANRMSVIREKYKCKNRIN